MVTKGDYLLEEASGPMAGSVQGAPGTSPALAGSLTLWSNSPHSLSHKYMYHMKQSVTSNQQGPAKAQGS